MYITRNGAEAEKQGQPEKQRIHMYNVRATELSTYEKTKRDARQKTVKGERCVPRRGRGRGVQ